MEKFYKYTSAVDQELQSIIFSMLNLIECKSKTVRKLIRLHMKIKKVRDITNQKYKGRVAFEEDPLFTDLNLTVSNESLFMTSISEAVSKLLLPDEVSGKPRHSKRKENSFEEDCSQSNGTYEFDKSIDENNNNEISQISDFVQDEASSRGKEFSNKKLKTIDESEIKKVENSGIVQDEPSWEGTKNLQEDLTNVKNDNEIFQDPDFVKDDPSSERNKNSKEQLNNSNENHEKIKNHQESIADSVPNSEIKPQESNKHENEDIKSFKTFCIISSVKCALSFLKQCRQEENGVFMDMCSYRNILDMFQTVLHCCADDTNVFPQAEYLAKISQSSTQKCTVCEKVPKRLVSSTTECRKTVIKKHKPF